MKTNEAIEKFIQTWGSLASSWGINRTMAMVHALLLSSPEPLSTDDIMERLQISRGNANMNIRDLMDWGIVRKELKMGERKEYFAADKDIWTVFKHITQERRKRELEPLNKSLQELKALDENTAESRDFVTLIDNISNVSSKVDTLLNLLAKSDETWMMNKLLKLIK